MDTMATMAFLFRTSLNHDPRRRSYMGITRRIFVLGAPLVGVAGCTTVGPDLSTLAPQISPHYAAMYAAIDTEPFPVPAVDLSEVDPKFLRREVAYATSEQPGTIVVEPSQRYAYLVLPNGRALRYGVGVGKDEAF